MSSNNRELVKFDLTREDITPRPGHDWQWETPYAAEMAHQDLHVECSDHQRFQKVLALACQMMELANPGNLAQQTILRRDEGGRPIAAKVTVIPSREPSRQHG